MKRIAKITCPILIGHIVAELFRKSEPINSVTKWEIQEVQEILKVTVDEILKQCSKIPINKDQDYVYPKQLLNYQ